VPSLSGCSEVRIRVSRDKEREYSVAVDPGRLERLRVVLFYATVALLAYLGFRIFKPFLAPLAWAAILAVVTYPVHGRIARRFKPNTAALISTVWVTALLIIPTVLVLIAFVREAVQAVDSIRLGVELGRYAWADRLWQHLQDRFPRFVPSDLGTVLHTYAEEGAAFIARRLGDILRNTAAFLLDLIFTIFSMFYFFRDGEAIVDRLRNSLPFEQSQRLMVVENTRGLIFATVMSSLVAAASHGIIGGLTFALTGIKTPVFWGVLMAFFSLIPLFGTALIWVPLALSLILGGHLWAGIVLAGVCSIVIGTVDNFLRPLLISGHAGMSKLLIFIGVIGGIDVFGLLGVVLGPIIIATAATLLNVYVPGADGERAARKANEKESSAVVK
jgi:predicted PurR-regulated permease PerM